MPPGGICDSLHCNLTVGALPLILPHCNLKVWALALVLATLPAGQQPHGFHVRQPVGQVSSPLLPLRAPLCPQVSSASIGVSGGVHCDPAACSWLSSRCLGLSVTLLTGL